MSNPTFFNEQVAGGDKARRCEVYTTHGCVCLDTFADELIPSAQLSPETAKRLGRALIKAGKFAEKSVTPAKPSAPTLPQ